MKIIVTMLSTNLVTNLLLPLFVLRGIQKHESNIHQVRGLVARNISVVCL